MDIEIREDSVLITGYVNAVERLSKPIRESLHGKIRTFLERIKAGAFGNALKRNDNVLVLLNHDHNRVLASTGEGTAKLEEDNIGLRAEIEIKDAEVVQKAREGKLSGWSFGFYANDDELGKDGDNETRTVTDLDLVEVSILDDTKSPAYYGTSIEARSEGVRAMEVRTDTIAEINKEAQDKHEEVSAKTDAELDESYDEHIDIESEAEEKKMEIFANLVASKVIEMLKPTDEKPADEESAEDEQTEEEPIDEKAEDDFKDECRSIDYSEYESRINSLNNTVV